MHDSSAGVLPLLEVAGRVRPRTEQRQRIGVPWPLVQHRLQTVCLREVHGHSPW